MRTRRCGYQPRLYGRRELLAVGMLGRNSRIAARIESLLRRNRSSSPRASTQNIAAGAAALGILALAGSLAPPWLLIAQQPAFEVVSIKPNKSGERRYALSRPIGDRFVATNVTVSMLLQTAEKVEGFQLSGAPAWVNTDRFDIEGRAPANLTAADFPGMLRTLLAGRFHLQTHRETKEAAVYLLTAAKSGPKLREAECVGRPSPVNPCGAFSGSARGALIGRTAPLREFTVELTRILGRTVIDRTSLAGRYDFDLHWTPHQSPAPASDEGAPDPNGPTIFTAVEEQLGLKLESARSPQPFLIVDRIEKPNAN